MWKFIQFKQRRNLLDNTKHEWRMYLALQLWNAPKWFYEWTITTISLEVESIRTNFELIFVEFFELFFTVRINRIMNFRIERISNESSIWKIWLHPAYSWSRIESNEFRIGFHWIFRIFFAISNQSNLKLSNRTNFEQIPILKIWFHPIVGVELK